MVLKWVIGIVVVLLIFGGIAYYAGWLKFGKLSLG